MMEHETAMQSFLRRYCVATAETLAAMFDEDTAADAELVCYYTGGAIFGFDTEIGTFIDDLFGIALEVTRERKFRNVAQN